MEITEAAAGEHLRRLNYIEDKISYTAYDVPSSIVILVH